MKAAIFGKKLSGTVKAVASKSCAHRLLICAALADAPCTVEIAEISEDIAATARCLEALGATAERVEEGYRVTPADWNQVRECTLDCGESGSTLRFLLPLAARLPKGSKVRFTGRGRLPERPNTALIQAMRLHNASVSDDYLPLTVEGPISGGMYMLPGNVSSQFITGLLFTLPALPGTSYIRFTTNVESASYINLTISALRQFGVTINTAMGGYDIPGGQVFRSPGTAAAEGDWSNAAFWLTAKALGSGIEVTGLNEESVQGDSAVVRVLDSMRGPDGRLCGTRVDAADIPDLVPVLAVAATQAEGETVFVNAGRLRIKESDRLAAVCRCLTILGADIRETEDGLIVRGKTQLHGGTVPSFNDHRMVMSMAVAATVADGPVVIEDAGAVAKSYPAFFDDYAMLGGDVRLES
ncbi:MAG: 3-phosphoshikimate 1-carboxyvinyltransferase [Clostridia bacterium]|nr:3-phosphoshikimate 1-carboxyvinyltransferase [Clostridia bacterium]